MTTELATFAAGCFWGVESDFRSIDGVINATVGYTGGQVDHPTYELVCSGRTGHAEAVLVEYDPTRTSYEELTDAFFQIHDPTQVNRQGPDLGEQYRSAIFVHSPEQASIARETIARVQPRLSRPIATEVTEASTFWPAEEYHQHYFEKHGVAHCRLPN